MDVVLASRQATRYSIRSQPIFGRGKTKQSPWIPACAGMTSNNYKPKYATAARAKTCLSLARPCFGTTGATLAHPRQGS
jgi:hypothetical protein